MQDEPVEVFGIGFGFIAMKSGVFESMDRPWFRIRGVQWDGLDFECNIGEDYSWCMNARNNGFRVMLDPTVRVKHHKEIIYELRPS
jgi:GT2 family glycosyltransferase